MNDNSHQNIHKNSRHMNEQVQNKKEIQIKMKENNTTQLNRNLEDHKSSSNNNDIAKDHGQNQGFVNNRSQNVKKTTIKNKDLKQNLNEQEDISINEINNIHRRSSIDIQSVQERIIDNDEGHNLQK